MNGPQCTSKQFLSTRLINLDGAASQSISATHNKRHLKIEPLCFSSLLHNWWLAGSKIKLQNLNANCRAASMSVIFSYSCTVDSQGTRFFALSKLSFFTFVKLKLAFGFNMVYFLWMWIKFGRHSFCLAKEHLRLTFHSIFQFLISMLWTFVFRNRSERFYIKNSLWLKMVPIKLALLHQIYNSRLEKRKSCIKWINQNQLFKAYQKKKVW